MAPKDLSVTSDMAVADSLCVAGFGAEWARGTRDNADSLDSKTVFATTSVRVKSHFTISRN